MISERQLQEFLDELFKGDRCSWCGDTGRRLYGRQTRLCGSCRRIQYLIRKCERDKDKHPFGSDELDIARRMERLAKEDGARFGDPNTKKVDGLLLEHTFNEVATLAVGKELPYCDANTFEEFFTLGQRRFLYYLLSAILRMDARRNRKTQAAYSAN